jgi:GNAT superfamily N-acetyltransferase
VPVHSSAVVNHWTPRRIDSTPSDHYLVVVDDTVAEDRAVTTLAVVDGPRIVTVAPAIAERTGLRNGSLVSASDLGHCLVAAGIRMNGADDLFYLPVDRQETLRTEAPPDGTRQLTAADAVAFELFCTTAPPDELDDAFVALDHWLVYGTFADGILVAAASMYPWGGTRFADLGVITLPEYRGHGYGKRTVRAISAHALADGYEPQYRCQIDNAPSIALAGAAGFELFGVWDVIAPQH